jgi:Tol biopolymer transport system component
VKFEAGTTLLHYRLAEKIGEGAMGVVWRAQDTTLDREVAIKILPAEFAADTERLARFEREAKSLASLNHPNIAAIYGFHEAQGVRFLAMELVAGDDLSRRIARGPLPLDEALDAARQVAAGLYAAHETGIIHRDLKPANVKITHEGQVKLLDFGLAKNYGPQAVSGPGGAGGSGPSMTMTTAGTAAGMILGTAAYMSPEQARGKPVDRRTDVWAFGCVLYEMLTGRVAFPGETVTDVLAAIVHKDPAWDALPSAARPRIERVIKRCLVKDPRERVRDLSDLALHIRELASDRGGAAAAITLAPIAPLKRSWLPVVAIGLIGVLLGALAGMRLLAHPAATGKSTTSGARVTALSQATDLPGVQYSPNLSPDGKSLLYVTGDGGDEDIFLLRVGGENAINLTEAFKSNDYDPAFSPDGERIAFGSDREGGGLFVMGATGESPKKIASEGAHPSWSPDGRKIVCSTERVTNPLARNTIASLWVVDADSGEKKRIYEGDAVQPVWSPSGKRIAFFAVNEGQRDLGTIPAEGGTLTPVTHDAPADWDPFWSPDGRWLYFFSSRRGGPDLWRIAVDETTGAPGGEPEPVTTGSSRPMQGSISADGHRIALEIDASRGELLKIGFDPVACRPVGTPASLFTSSSPFAQVSVSHDGAWIVYRTTAPRENLFVMRTDGTGRRRLTDDAFRNRGPRWLNGDAWILFYSNRSGDYQLWVMRRDGTDLRQLVSSSGAGINVPTVTADGRRVAMLVQSKSGAPMMAIANVDPSWFGPGAPAIDPKVESAAAGFFPLSWSPDGTRIAGREITRNGPAIYAPTTQKLEPQRDRAGRDFGGWSSDAVWLPDGRHILAWDDRRDVAAVWDTATQELRDVLGLPGPSELDLSADGRTLILNRRVSEADIWMLTLE